MLRTGGVMEEKLMRQLEQLGLLFGYPQEAEHQAPLEADTDELYQNVLQSLVEAGATEETVDDLFQADIEEYTQQVDAVLAAHTVGG
tara:strand:+ start:4582 stop:4842 length:261 start_codon:yes stop_codon:yes gene_type:complete